MDRPSISVMSPTSPGALRDLPLVLPGQLSVSATLAQNQPRGSIWDGYMDANSPPPTWCLQVKLWYDKVGHQLNVNVLQAIDLPTRPDGRPRNPYVKMYFLPDRRYLFIWERKVMSALVFVFAPKQAWTLMNLSIREKAGRAVLFLVDDYGLTVWIGKHFKWHSLLWLYIQYIPIYFFRFLNLYQNH